LHFLPKDSSSFFKKKTNKNKNKKSKKMSTHASALDFNRYQQEATLTDVVYHLKAIEKNQAAAAKFNAGTYTALALAAAVGFVISLALGSALTQTFAKIPVGGGLLGAWIYAIIALVLGVALVFLIFLYLEPFLTKKFKPKEK
jgi:ElaB/YqjD/DUF883 family membrane-anchored ribosome-binding protein